MCTCKLFSFKQGLTVNLEMSVLKSLSVVNDLMIHWFFDSNDSFFLPLWKSMAAHRTACRKVVKFGTKIEDSLNINHTKFEVSNSNPLAPPTAQSCTHVYSNHFWMSRNICFFWSFFGKITIILSEFLLKTKFLWFLGSCRFDCTLWRHFENFPAILSILKNLLLF